jgi:hypothetical protein
VLKRFLSGATLSSILYQIRCSLSASVHAVQVKRNPNPSSTLVRAFNHNSRQYLEKQNVKNFEDLQSVLTDRMTFQYANANAPKNSKL